MSEPQTWYQRWQPGIFGLVALCGPVMAAAVVLLLHGGWPWCVLFPLPIVGYVVALKVTARGWEDWPTG